MPVASGSPGTAANPATPPFRLKLGRPQPERDPRRPCPLPEGSTWRRTATPPSPTRPRWLLPAAGFSRRLLPLQRPAICAAGILCRLRIAGARGRSVSSNAAIVEPSAGGRSDIDCGCPYSARCRRMSCNRSPAFRSAFAANSCSTSAARERKRPCHPSPPCGAPVSLAAICRCGAGDQNFLRSSKRMPKLSSSAPSVIW